MAELGTGVEVGDGEVSDVESQDLEAMIDQESAALASEDKGKGDDAAKTGKESAKPIGTGNQPPNGQQPTAATEEDKALLRELGFNEDEAKELTPKELERLKRVHGSFSDKIRAEKGRSEFFGKANKELSEKYKAQQKTLGEVMEQQTPADRAKGIVKSVDRSKLSQGVQKLLDDPEMLEFMGLFIPGAKEALKAPDATAEGGDDLPPEVKASVAPVHPDYLRVYQSTEFAAWANAQPRDVLMERLKTAEGHNEVLAEFKKDFKKAVETSDQMIMGEIAKAHPTFKEKFVSPGFREWIKKQSRNEQAKLRDTDPKGFIEVLNNFSTFEAAEAVKQRKQQEHTETNDALRTHGSPAGGIGESEDFTPDQILNDNNVFQAMKTRIRKNRVRGG